MSFQKSRHPISWITIIWPPRLSRLPVSCVLINRTRKPSSILLLLLSSSLRRDVPYKPRRRRPPSQPQLRQLHRPEQTRELRRYSAILPAPVSLSLFITNLSLGFHRCSSLFIIILPFLCLDPRIRSKKYGKLARR